MTLRARLILTVVVLTAAALLALAAVTYASQRGALLDQVDDQLQTAQNGVSQRLARENGLALGNGPAVPPGVRGPRPFAGVPGAGRDPDDDAVGRGGGDLQPGTYAELRSAAGTKVGRSTGANPSFDAEALAAPVLPAVLRPGMTFTASAKGDDGLRYRVRTIARPAGAPGPGRVGGDEGG